MKLVFETRFSYLGKSDWTSEESGNAKLLYAEARMLRRFELFEKITLPSLKDQSDQDFVLLLLCGRRMPREFLHHLRWVCERNLDAEQFQILIRRPLVVGKVFRDYVGEVYSDEDYVIQTVLDDDDALACDFVEICKKEAVLARARSWDDDPAHVLSFTSGYALGIENGNLLGLAAEHRPFVNTGLSLVAPPDSTKSPLLMSPDKIGQLHQSTVINTRRPFFLRTDHALADGRTSQAAALLDPQEFEKACGYFPLLRSFGSLDAATDEAAE